MSSFDRSPTTCYSCAIVSIALSCIIFELFDAERVRGHSRSLNMVPFERLAKFSYSHSIVTEAVHCIVSEM